MTGRAEPATPTAEEPPEEVRAAEARAALVRQQLADLKLPAHLKEWFWGLAGSLPIPFEVDSTSYFDESDLYGDDD